MEHEITYGIEYYVLSQGLWYPHCLRLLLITFSSSRLRTTSRLATPQRPFECLAPHEVARLIEHLLIFIRIARLLTILLLLLLLFLHSLLELLIQHLLQHTLPDVFFLPDAVIVHILR